ncbi:hypothetical protein [Hymenobacter latericus]|uniref:hypothetical protein n=1 Tax=Hymenobacter sp. YIM 151858-1 TaxID=2987688 RepID=UPI002227686F|nr:hypothetical protein [Hymenobacter sp. YIM 151858-1]UYZ60866.1 hypothetical protein OIS50_08700 [Hymenobacter sp. YIM 151858-1]
MADFSGVAANALEYATFLARQLTTRQMSVRLRVLSVAADLGTADGLLAHPTLPPLPALEQRLATLERLRETSVTYTHELLQRPVAECLPEMLSASLPSVLICGRANLPANAAEHPVLQLIRLVTQPLLLVPEHYHEHVIPQRIVFDTDRRPAHLPKSVSIVPEFLLQFQTNRVLYLGQGRAGARRLLTRVIPEAVAIHIYTTAQAPEPDDILANVHATQLLDGLSHTIQTNQHSSIEQGIIETALSNAADLLMFVARQQSLPGSRFYNSPTAGLMLRTPIPALVIPEAAPVLWPG